ncbi:MAG: ArnT family glycosyltransferase [Acidimicrobiia bacterium]
MVHHAGTAAPGTDAMINLAVARRFAAGLGATLPDGRLMTFRAPLWPVTTGVLMWGLRDPLGAYVARALVAASVAVGVLVLTRRWYGRSTALVALMLTFATTAVLGVLGDWYADGLAASLALVGLALLERAVRSGERSSAVVAGAVFGLAILTKENASFVMLGPVVAALAVTRRRGWAWARPAVTAFAAAGAVVVPWLWVHLAVEHRLYLTSVRGTGAFVVVAGVSAAAFVGLLAAFRAGVPGRRLVEAVRAAVERVGPGTAALVLLALWVGAITAGLAAGLPFAAAGADVDRMAIVRDELLPAFGLVPLVVVAVGALAIGVRRRARSEVAHAAAIVGMLPVLVLWPLNGSPFVARNAILAVVLVQIAAARGVVLVWRAARTAVTRDRARAAIPVAAALVAAVAAAWAVVGVSFGPARTPSVVASERVRDLDALDGWLGAHVRPGTPIVGSYVDWTWIARDRPDRFDVHLAPWTHLAADGPHLRPAPVIPVTGDPEPSPPRPYGEDWLAVTRSPTKGYVLGLSQTALLAELRRTRARVLVVTNLAVRSPIAIVNDLERIPGIRRAARFGRTVVLTVERARLRRVPDVRTWVDAAACRWLARLRPRPRLPAHPRGAVRPGDGSGAALDCGTPSTSNRESS